MAQGRSSNSYLINRKLQWKMIRYALAITAINCVTMFLATQFIFNRFMLYVRSLEAAGTSVPPILDALHFWMNASCVGIGVLTILPIFFVTLVLSHKLAGPIDRLMDHLEESSKNLTFDKIHFRENDGFPELERTFNRYIGVMAEAYGKHANPEPPPKLSIVKKAS